MHATRSRTFQRVALGLSLAAVTAVAVCAAAALWLLRDPEPYFRARRAPMTRFLEDSIVPDGAHTEQDVVVTARNGLRVELRVRRRAEGDAAASASRITHHPSPITRLPVFVLLGGHMHGKESASLIRETGPRIVASVSYPFDGNERAVGLAVVREVPAIRRAIFDTPPATMLALDYLLQRADVDSTRVELVGASFGAPFAPIVAALDRRVTRLWLVQGGANPYALINVGLREEIPWPPARAAVAGLANLLASGPRFDPARWVARVSPRPVMMVNTTGDERVPRQTTEALWAAARDPKEIVWLPGLHMQPNRPDVLGALIGAVFSRDGMIRPAMER
jgi:hypothetical protein